LKIVLLNQYYPPDRSPTARYLRDLAESLATKGYSVEVLCSQAVYRSGETRDKSDSRVRVKRFWAPSGRSVTLKALGYAAYYIQTSLYLLFHPRPDLILALSSPPFLGILAKLFGRTHAHWVMDAYPQVLFSSGALRQDGLIGWILSRLVAWQYRGATQVIALGPDMARRLIPELNFSAYVQPLWLPSDMPASPSAKAVAHVRKTWGVQPGRRILLYAGNLGRGHRYMEFVEAMRKLGSKGPLWVFMGDGAGFKLLKKIQAAEPALPLLIESPHFGMSYAARMAAADAHLVSLQEGWQGLIVPSKLQASLASGKPVIFVGPQDCESARWIKSGKAGWVVSPDDIESLIKLVKHPRSELAKRGRSGKSWALKNFEMKRSLNRMLEQIKPNAAL
jgi:glycosyltransferase involved in cell wall biosynthesis